MHLLLTIFIPIALGMLGATLGAFIHIKLYEHTLWSREQCMVAAYSTTIVIVIVLNIITSAIFLP